ncbi:hypothetical protein [Gordonia pseudamarae]|uniref:Uncharacterized protein n=1 Tax=Gordonia pseudamarae TaxID=2831662 RepID=A0ABX6IP27_9ACTN|nr:hypothetical protein [Gordonia pseudamarae]QHN36910.1 hypothetical protein GII31_20425 [Gordonia pseudamarae]
MPPAFSWSIFSRLAGGSPCKAQSITMPPACAPFTGTLPRMGTAVVDAITAAGITYRRTDFADPHLSGPTALTVTADGHVYGHLATWGSCHIGYGDQCVTPPSSTSGYQYFHQGIVDTDDGALPVGKITLGTGHAGLGEDAASAAAHYDNTGAVTAIVRAGEDAHGIWLAGRLVPGIGDQRVDELRRSGVSGDWRGINGNLELVAALAVNVPGFPVPRTEQLVASGGVSTLVAAGIVPPASALLPQSVAELDAYVLSKVRAVARAEVARTRLADARSMVASARRARRTTACDVLVAVTASAHEQRATRVGRARNILGDATSRARRARDAKAVIAAATAPPSRATVARDTITAAIGARGLNRGADPINRGRFSAWTTSSSPTPDATAPAKAEAHTFTVETLTDELRAIGISEATTNTVVTRDTVRTINGAVADRTATINEGLAEGIPIYDLSDTQLRTVDLLEMVQEGTTNLPADDPAVLELGYHVANPPTVPVWDARDHYPTESFSPEVLAELDRLDQLPDVDSVRTRLDDLGELFEAASNVEEFMSADRVLRMELNSAMDELFYHQSRDDVAQVDQTFGHIMAVKPCVSG